MFLEMKDLRVLYGKSLAVNRISIIVDEGSIVSIIGANGSGKSTVLKALAGLVTLASGEIFFNGQRINGLSAMDIVKKGIVLVPEGRQLFPYLTVLNNLMLGASIRKDKKGIEQDLSYVFELFPWMKERRRQKVGTLSGGEQQMVAIARGLMVNPKVYCMDEPSLGLAPKIVEQVGNVIKNVNQRGVTLVLVEQNVHLALEVAKYGYVLQVGRVVAEGDVATLKSMEVVRKAYLGE